MFPERHRNGSPAPIANAVNETMKMSRYLRLPYPLFPTASRAPTDAGCRSNRAGFTIIELIVCMGVVAILCGILLPSLRATRQAAERVSCACNQRHIGVGLSMYANNNNDRICRSVNAEGSTPQRQELMAVRLRQGRASAGPQGWDGLGLLVDGGYLDRSECLYCASHHGEHSFERYAAEFAKPAVTIEVFGNYQYSGHVRPRTTNGQPGEAITMDAGRNVLLLTDGLRTQSDFNHGNGLNRMMGDLSVEFWYDSQDAVRMQLPELPLTVATEYESEQYGNIWAQLTGVEP